MSHLYSYLYKGPMIENVIFDLVEAPSDNLTNFHRLEYRTGKLSKSHSTHFSKEWLPTLHLLLTPRNWEDIRSATENRIENYRLIQIRVDRACMTFTWFTVLVYAAARIALLVLAFTTLRKQDERLYIDTWTRFLPSIS